MAGTFQFKSNGKAIAIGFTDQRLSPHAGSAVFWGWLRPSRWVAQLSAALSHRLLPIEKALAFMHGCSATPGSSPTLPICGETPSSPNCWALNG